MTTYASENQLVSSPLMTTIPPQKKNRTQIYADIRQKMFTASKQKKY